MNCPQCQEQLAAYIEDLLVDQEKDAVASHLRDCSKCRLEADQHRQLRDRLFQDASATSKSPLAPAVMNRIVDHQAPKPRRISMSKRYGRMGLGLAAAAAITALLVVPWGEGQHGRAAAAEVFARAVKATSGLKSVYMKLNVRTIPNDNFEYIQLDRDFVPYEMWKQFGDLPKYRVEKPGRIVESDGQTALLVIDGVGTERVASEGAPDTGYVGWIKMLLDVDQVLDSELRCAERNGWDFQVTEEKGSDGTLQQVVTIEAVAMGDFTNDWLRNKTINDSDQRRVFRFDLETGRLEDLDLWVHGDDGDVLVLDIAEIAYDPEIDPGLFDVEPPKSAIWFVEPGVLPDNDKYARMSPSEAARAFFQALADEDWDEVLKFYPFSDLTQKVKDVYGGLEIIEIGEPFQSGGYPGWFVPYKVRIEYAGAIPYVKEFNLALRNDNPAGRYVVDGGF
jgi:hypothetical protein